MINLRRLSTHAGIINIMEDSSTKYRDIGTILLNDRSGTIVAGIEESARGKPLEAVDIIYARWMREDVDYSWRKLTQCFRDCDLNVLANNIEEHFGLQQSMFFFDYIWQAEQAYLVVQLARFFYIIYIYIYVSDDAFWPRDCPRATRKRNRPCLFRSPSMRSILFWLKVSRYHWL